MQKKGYVGNNRTLPSQYDEGYSPKDNLSTISFHAEQTLLSYTFSHEYRLWKRMSFN